MVLQSEVCLQCFCLYILNNAGTSRRTLQRNNACVFSQKNQNEGIFHQICIFYLNDLVIVVLLNSLEKKLINSMLLTVMPTDEWLTCICLPFQVNLFPLDCFLALMNWHLHIATSTINSAWSIIWILFWLMRRTGDISNSKRSLYTGFKILHDRSSHMLSPIDLVNREKALCKA